MFSRAVSRAYRPRASDSTPMRAFTASESAAQSRPSTFAVPCVGVTSVEIIRNVVVLPAPLGPRSPVIAPSGAVKVTWRTASMNPAGASRPRKPAGASRPRNPAGASRPRNPAGASRPRSPKRFARSRTSIIRPLRSLLSSERQHEQRARDALEALAVEALRASLADERVDQSWGAAVQAHAVPQLRGDEMARVS